MKFPIFNVLLVKLATRCNLNCTYCYWFRDQSVYEKPPIMSIEAETNLLIRLEEHIITHQLKRFTLLFHGGEPLLFGKKRFSNMVTKIKSLEKETNCLINLGITTNGTLIDDEWIEIFKNTKLSVTVSIDGPEKIHDARRVDLKGEGSFVRVLQGIKLMKKNSLEPRVLAVCEPLSDPDIIVEFFVNSLGIKYFDILIPDATHEDIPHSIAEYYKRLFDLWFDIYSVKGVEIRYTHSIAKSILGIDPQIDSIGYGPIQLVTVLTDGTFNPLDVLNITNMRSIKNTMSVHSHAIQDVIHDPVWQEAYHASLELPSNCVSCEYQFACGGGYLPHRWSNKGRFNNSSIYCSDIKEIFNHAWERIASKINIVKDDNKTINLFETIKNNTFN
ncbi:radical SAM protein [Paenibacillus alvei]|uniref:radical SAM protein n=1 Tax=Paenibacillus alvei TaxID=44250 RepID=UPI0018CD4864|nr:radical SAM protein [Paenibacillus alvei]MCY9579266.1 radical SAM protein [Paenibacillus alvei]MCY9583722.1 radical SAM protein [Paenibacillus alvei]